MEAYEFYWLDPKRGNQIIRSSPPERRKNPERITQKSIVNWGEEMFGEELENRQIPEGTV
jgi:hypothetical protein